MPNPENLNKRKSFVKNDPRINKTGRPCKLPELQIILAKVLGEEKDGRTAAEAILQALRARSMKGGAEGNRAAEILLNRGYGLPKQIVDVTGSLEVKTITGMQVK
jgi:hypothetical protein